MRVDDLRRELAAAAEVGPLASDARGRVGRRARWLRLRRRVVSGVVAVALVTAGLFALLASRGDDRVGVVTTPGSEKEVAPERLKDPDALVYSTPGSAGVLRRAFDSSDAVRHYGVLDSCGPVVAGLDLTAPEAEAVQRLRGILPADVQLKPLSSAAGNAAPQRDDDLEVYLAVDATPAQVASLEQVLRDAPEVAGLRFLSKQDALEEYRRMFAGDPETLAGVGADDLPESFRVNLADGVDPEVFAAGLDDLQGVDEVMVRDPLSDADPSVVWATFAGARSGARATGVELYMAVDASSDQIAAVGERLRGSPLVTAVQFVSKEDAVAEFRRGFADQPELLSKVGAGDLPTSFRVGVEEPYEKSAEAVRALVAGMPGVDEVLDACGWFGFPEWDDGTAEGERSVTR